MTPAHLVGLYVGAAVIAFMLSAAYRQHIDPNSSYDPSVVIAVFWPLAIVFYLSRSVVRGLGVTEDGRLRRRIARARAEEKRYKLLAEVARAERDAADAFERYVGP